jgi:phosphoenolpyruvate-protein phosphotransferase
VARELAFRFPLQHGLHARPAAALSEAAAPWTSVITLVNRRTTREALARSTLALVATLTRQGDECSLHILGEDEVVAFEAMRRFVTEELPLLDEEVAAVAAEGTKPLPRVLRGEGGTVWRGTAASGGIARGLVRKVVASARMADLGTLTPGTPEQERARFELALARVRSELRRRCEGAGNAAQRAILDVHLAILDDVELHGRVVAALQTPGTAAGHAVTAVAEHFAATLAGDGTTLLAERALDIRDVAALVVEALYPELSRSAPLVIDHDTVLVAETLGPGQLMAVGADRLEGLVLGQGGATSHTVILARAHGVPCVTGAADAVRALRDGQAVVVDGERGLVVADPTPAAGRFYDNQMAALRAARERSEIAAARPAETADRVRVEVGVNVGTLAEVRRAFAAGAEGIGLFRTELLFMDRTRAPDEDEQTHVYAEAARFAAGRPVIIRTLDVGGDKPIPYLHLPAEPNPFLGFRAIRIYEQHREMAAAQIRAILRASAHGDVRIIFPMVGCLEEFRALRRTVTAQMEALTARGVAFDPGIQVGVMVEVPALAFAVQELSAEADFFSIGSNDLLQYLLAVDRGNERVAHLYDPYRPAFLRTLAAICRSAKAAGRWIGLCGELGADPLAIPFLVGIGLDEVSVGAARIAAVKSTIARYSVTDCRELAATVLASEISADVATHLRAFAGRAVGRPVCAAELVRLRSQSASKEEAIRELVDMLAKGERVADVDEVEDAVWRREDVSSTGVGFSLAIPHCRCAAVRSTSIAVASYPDGLDWTSADGERVTMAILIAVGAESADDAHLKMIAALARRLMDDELRGSLLAAQGADEVVDLLQVVAAVE